jgi:hypothetical protein
VTVSIDLTGLLNGEFVALGTCQQCGAVLLFSPPSYTVQFGSVDPRPWCPKCDPLPEREDRPLVKLKERTVVAKFEGDPVDYDSATPVEVIVADDDEGYRVYTGRDAATAPRS